MALVTVWLVLEISTDHKQNEYKKSSFQYLKTEFKLSITSETNLKIVNFFDVTLNLNTGAQEPYSKPNNNPLISIQIIYQK